MISSSVWCQSRHVEGCAVSHVIMRKCADNHMVMKGCAVSHVIMRKCADNIWS